MAKAKKSALKPQTAPEVTTITIHNKISPTFRAIHVDGAYGGITPKGMINLNFFSERFTIPKSSTLTFSEFGSEAAVTNSADSLEGILRQYEVGIFTDIDTARNILKLLSAKVAELENIEKEKKP